MNEKQNGIVKNELRAAKKFLETLHDSLVKVEKELRNYGLRGILQDNSLQMKWGFP